MGQIFYCKIFTTGVESTQHVESINGVLKKHLDRGTLLKELVKVIENELEKESQYTQIKDYYGSNLSVGLPLTYNTIFKEIDHLLQIHLSPISLSLQYAQMKQFLLYQATLIEIDQVTESNLIFNGIIEHEYDMPQIQLHEFLLDIPANDLQELWKIFYIAITSTSSTKPYYVIIFKDSISICTCMSMINKGMSCRHQYRVFLQSSKTMFHIAFINNR
ncbi:hypothetical protein RclHR1_04710010 [Rhizophagus clarus]|uniref:SWIM-type domain-containing protein n=1 Tax=Rhizophagus clarus TaxID=94130 RepID=A0A2Z6S1M2_9GLOM|nr:hypothetical protein RclHR1_04710010 [Rhizophagus clarus]GES77417.1 hypothetical protein GLOIN_2v1774635 [Rhizophagus clarus]